VTNRFKLIPILMAFALSVSVISEGEATPVAIANPGFETVETIAGTPGTFGDWGQDQASIVTAENGVTPLGGSRMLKFVGTGPDPVAAGSFGDVVQLVDLSAYSTSIATGMVDFELSAFFNRIAQGGSTDTVYFLSIKSYGGTDTAGDYAASLGALASTANASSGLNSDNDLLTWENVTTTLTLPTDTTFVAISLVAQENVLNDNTFPGEFIGNYADNVSATLTNIVADMPVPEPGTYLIFGLGLIGLTVLRRRRKNLDA
jgi:hypothetical protein